MMSAALGEPLLDQAAGLRSLMARQAPRLVTVIESREAGRHGVAAGLARALAAQQRGILVLDETEPGTARHLSQSGERMANSSKAAPLSLGEVLAGYGCTADFVLVDASAAADGGLSRLAAGAHDVVIVLRGNDPTGVALTAAYGAIKRLHAMHALLQFRILLADCDTESRAYGVFCRLATVASRYLTVSLSFCGYLPGPAASPVALNNGYVNVARGMLLWGR